MALAVGTILVLALPPYSILPFALIAFAVLAIMLRGASWPIAFRLGYLFGLGQFVPGLFWITESFQVETDRFGWLALPAVFGLAALLAVFPALACALAARMARAGLPLSLSLATSWTGLEWLRGHVLTGFPWNLAAYTLADWLPFAQVASLVGSYGLGFLLVLCSALAGLAFRTPDRRLQVVRFASAGAIAVTVAGFGFARLNLSDPPSERGAQIRVVQPNIAQSAKWDEGSRKAKHPAASGSFCASGRLRYPSLARNSLAGVSCRRHRGPRHALAGFCRIPRSCWRAVPSGKLQPPERRTETLCSPSRLTALS